MIFSQAGKRRRPASILSRCPAAGRAPKALTAASLLKVMMVFSALLLFGLGHLHLQFSLNALESETSQLQSLQGTLRSEVKALQGKTQSLKRPERLFDYARLELGMVPYQETGREVLEIPREIFSRYELARAAQARTGSESPELARAIWLNKLSDRVGLIGQALAGEIKSSKK